MSFDMSRGAAKFTLSDAGRIFKAARNAGVEVKVEFRPDGTIVAFTGKTETATTNSAIVRSEWDDHFNDKNPA